MTTAITFSKESSTWICQGDWSLNGVAALENQIKQFPSLNNTNVIIDGHAITHFDSSGAWVLCEFISALENRGLTVTLNEFNNKQSQLIEIVDRQKKIIKEPLKTKVHPSLLYQIGEQTIIKMTQANRLLAFIGELTVTFMKRLINLSQLSWKSLISVIDNTGFQALPIIALLIFLIGVVLAYQMGMQLQYYGANIYIVNLTGMAILREFGPLITAILVAGRTGSSFTAQIGTMKVNEEIDALTTMGISAIDRIVIPKMLGLLITVPLLTVWADCFGVFGSMVMSNTYLDLGYYDFLIRFEHAVPLKHYLIGLIKTPVFALIIATVGCFQGFQVSSSAESVGKQTTKSVVQAIFLIIIVDALFSVLFSWRGI